MTEATIIDSRGSACPGPITDLARAYRNSKVGDLLELWATDKGVQADTAAWAKKTGNEILEVKVDPDKIVVKIKINKR
ncbi:MAG: sulfurtransferase TusA family protein [Candidatus Thermoplasmatota archaeon]|jgi:TusA-related sulfurtransferase|nr:sulfurtransferase TusA family protein [Candidatus Thermoplasmatota archaeon]